MKIKLSFVKEKKNRKKKKNVVKKYLSHYHFLAAHFAISAIFALISKKYILVKCNHMIHPK